MDKLFTTTSSDILRILVSSLVIYVLVIIYIRILGKRSTSQLNNFDWIVTVSVGALFASTILTKKVSATEGGAAILFLLILQFIVTKSMIYSNFIRKMVKSTPQLILLEGEFLHENMKKARILKVEVYAAIRQEGYRSLDDIYAVVLETNSKLSVLPQDDSDQTAFSLYGVKGLPMSLESQIYKNDKL